MLRLPTPQRPARRGYTLVELLVVIAIIGILVGLVLSAVGKLRDKGNEFTARADITGLETVLTQFKGKYNGRFPPCSGQGAPFDGTNVLTGTFRLCSEYPASIAAAAASPELAQLKALWPRFDQGFNGLLLDATTAPKFVLWDSTSTGANAPTTFNGMPVTKVAGPILLDPNQCLVFFLSGGLSMDYLGFTTSATQPFFPSAAPNPRSGPLYDFKQNRMQKPSAWLAKHAPEIQTLTSAPSGFTATAPFRWEGGTDTLTTVGFEEPWFLDPWKTPYLYMATSGVGTGGDYPFRGDVTPKTQLVIGPWGGKISAFNNNAAGPSAFREPALNNKWLNHTGFQIVSGGANGSDVNRDNLWGFGPGGQAQFGKTSGYTKKDAGGDDFANFRSAVLSATD